MTIKALLKHSQAFVTAVALCVTLANPAKTVAATVDDVRYLVESGQFETAIETAEPLLKKTPRDAALNYWYAIAQMEVGSNSEARKALAVAAERGYTEAYPALIELDIDSYDVTTAQSHLDDWSGALSRARKPTPADFETLRSRVTMLNNQLERIEDIPVIARYDVPRQTFLNAIARINDPANTQTFTFLPGDIPFYINNRGREAFWTAPDSNGINRLYTAGILDDGTVEDPIDLTQYVGEGNIIAPFLLEDGETLYFASSRNNDNLGGYDIYMTRRNNDGTFYEPSNIGMPYNSPADDLLYVVDETNNVAWWVTDRFTSADTVSVLVFIPGETRRNIDPDEESDLKARARVTDIKASQPKDLNIAQARKRIPTPESVENNQGRTNTTVEMQISLGNGTIITPGAKLKNPDSSRTMTELIRTKRELDDNIERLDTMRGAYRDGNKTLKEDIRALETQVERQQNEFRTLRNKLIRLETNGR